MFRHVSQSGQTLGNIDEKHRETSNVSEFDRKHFCFPGSIASSCSSSIQSTSCSKCVIGKRLHGLHYRSLLLAGALCAPGEYRFRHQSQSRSQSMPVRGLGCGMTLGKSNRNRYLIGCRDHQCCRTLMRVFCENYAWSYAKRELSMFIRFGMRNQTI
jgi:hypothetical protein